ncbi:MAG: hypothetical protein D6743_00615 [Calditrichaeota bacterium]|nr:MAG: hypothetical protein D6743_00615 [Calditrichota bacterium]
MQKHFRKKERHLSALGWAAAWGVTAGAMVLTGGSVAWLAQGSDMGLGVSLAAWLLAGWCTAVHLRGRLSRFPRLRFASVVAGWGLALLFAVGVRIWLRPAFVFSRVNGNLLLAFLAAAAGSRSRVRT